MTKWLELLDTEYLSDFLAAGGGSVKFVIGPTAGNPEAPRELIALAQGKGYVTVHLDSAQTRLNRSDHVFFEIARRIEVHALALNYLVAWLRSRSIDANPLDGVINPEELQSRYPDIDMRGALKECLEELYRDYALTYEFRLAMLQICRSHIGGASHCGPAVEQWLRGDLRRISEVKEAKLFSRIGRHNARLMLQSLVRWLRKNGRKGLVLSLDISRCLEQVRPAERTGGIYYSSPALTEVYEVLRQLVDASADFTGTLIVVYAPSAFLESEKKGVDRYQALKMRIFDDIHLSGRQNPLSPLYRLALQESAEAR
jgi:hypothetical protein